MALIRIVRLAFISEKIDDFIEIFENSKLAIAAFPGCKSVKMMRDADHLNVYYTYSTWNSNESLQLYRQSELFKTTWAKTKVLFCDKPQAYSLIEP